VIAWRAATGDDRTLAAVLAGGVATAAVLAAVAAPVAPALARLLPGCVFHALTGIPCPACGTTRAALALLAGDPFAALGFNPLATLAAVAAVTFALMAPLWLAAGGGIPRFTAAPAGGLPRGARLLVVSALAAQWAWLVVRGA
jgi:hypothetical protein